MHEDSEARCSHLHTHSWVDDDDDDDDDNDELRDRQLDLGTSADCS